MNISELNNALAEILSTSPFANKKLVFGKGPLEPVITLIGEAPGKEEEEQGQPFVGKAGKNLTEFLNSIGLKREDIYITNAVKIRPTQISPKTGNTINRTPDAEEIDFFNNFLHREIEIIKPRYIVTMGNVPLKAVSESNLTIGRCHGKIINSGRYKNIFALYHPASIIYNQSLKKVYIEDMKALRSILTKSH